MLLLMHITFFSVCHLAGKLLRAIKERQPDVGITDKDILCVEIAGLCHDLGKLPYYKYYQSTESTGRYATWT
jgi:hypothetical protein